MIKPLLAWKKKHPIFMKTNRKKKILSRHVVKQALTFGELIASTYAMCGKRQARKILQLALDSQLIRLDRRHGQPAF